MTNPFLYKRKPFPAPVRWHRVWRHRWIILDYLNQVAHGNWIAVEQAARMYGGTTEFGYALKRAANDIIDIGEER